MPLIPKLNLDQVRQELEELTPIEILQWMHTAFGRRIALQSSMQKTASTLTAMLAEAGVPADVVFVDTQYHFPETLETLEKLKGRYPQLNFVTLYPERTPEEQREDFGRELYQQDGDYQICCQLRKEKPWIAGVTGQYNAIIGGLMRSEGGKRKNLSIISVDDRVRAYKLYPLATWSVEEVDAYNEENDVPVHPLHAQGFPSIGCATCTTAVQPGEHPRAGRWRHIQDQLKAAQPDSGNGQDEEPTVHLYCGINHGEGI